MALSQANAAHAEQVECHLALLRAFVHRFDSLEGELDAQGGDTLTAGVVFAFQISSTIGGTPYVSRVVLINRHRHAHAVWQVAAGQLARAHC